MTFPLDELADFEPYVVGVQDPNDPSWVPDSDIADMTLVPDPNDEVDNAQDLMRNAHGFLEFLHGLEEYFQAYFEEYQEGPQQKKRAVAPIRTREVGSTKWRARTATVNDTAAQVDLVHSDHRRMVRLVNNGPNVVYVSSTTAIAGAPNTAAIPVSTATLWAPVDLPTVDDIYLVCAATQTASVSVYEFFDMDC